MIQELSHTKHSSGILVIGMDKASYHIFQLRKNPVSNKTNFEIGIKTYMFAVH